MEYFHITFAWFRRPPLCKTRHGFRGNCTSQINANHICSFDQPTDLVVLDYVQRHASWKITRFRQSNGPHDSSILIRRSVSHHLFTKERHKENHLQQVSSWCWTRPTHFLHHLPDFFSSKKKIPSRVHRSKHLRHFLLLIIRDVCCFTSNVLNLL